MPDVSRLSTSALGSVIAQSQALHKYALPVVELLYEQIAGTRNMVILSDAQGVVTYTLSDDDFAEQAERVALALGTIWSEQRRGTNGIGTAIAEGVPILVHGDDHYLHANRILSCSAAPIFNTDGAVGGVLAVAGDCQWLQRHTMALVRISAQKIENQLCCAHCQTGITLHFHRRPEFIGSLVEGIICFTPEGRFLSASRCAQALIGLSSHALGVHTMSSLFDIAPSFLLDHYRTAAPGLLQLRLPDGVPLYASASVRLGRSTFDNATVAPGESLTQRKTAAHSTPPRPNAEASRQLSSLRYLNTGDPQMSAIIAKLTKIKHSDIPILIAGETGTGKELLAQAIHKDSPRAGAPFVAVNCASLPETLIESELFGYEDGAFTGARKNGNIGRIRQANGGTLFLDEIGDMPLNLQARLLRVLQERTVMPLGGGKPVPVNVALICATHRNLRDMIAKGAFREDLYYRLNGLVVKLPPLRERTDLDVVIKKMLYAEEQSRRYSVASCVMQQFKQYNWPGNFRQLTNLLRTAMAMTAEDGEIRLEHLPDDFLDDVRNMKKASAAPAVAAALPANATLGDVELSVIQKALEAHGHNVSAAARALGISRNTIYRKLG
ncbi:sigma-54-dependent Fis family transcriptional regulator [Noviherbaspirillum autotrophicum]|uniref:sigma-54-dependent Fis family transcriptional regulator n=1 Tax=Noviherbaspirillum autotrophicum TaxID=709839 RepID=UPI000AA69DB9|nr:sigma-54-dependent Fis family transcriptional regulator [Noviherbaspirillum autotrophicum]